MLHFPHVDERAVQRRLNDELARSRQSKVRWSLSYLFVVCTSSLSHRFASPSLPFSSWLVASLLSSGRVGSIFSI
jgi:hypothetical protein